MLNSLELEEREIFSVEMGKEGIWNRWKVGFPILLSPSEDYGINAFWGRDTRRLCRRPRFRASIIKCLLVHFSFSASPKNSQSKLKPEDLRVLLLFTVMAESHPALPGIAQTTQRKRHDVTPLCNLNEKDGCWHVFLNMRCSKITFCRTVSKGRCRTKEVQALIWDNDGQEVAGGSEKMWVS